MRCCASRRKQAGYKVKRWKRKKASVNSKAGTDAGDVRVDAVKPFTPFLVKSMQVGNVPYEDTPSVSEMRRQLGLQDDGRFSEEETLLMWMSRSTLFPNLVTSEFVVEGDVVELKGDTPREDEEPDPDRANGAGGPEEGKETAEEIALREGDRQPSQFDEDPSDAHSKPRDKAVRFDLFGITTFIEGALQTERQRNPTGMGVVELTPEEEEREEKRRRARIIRQMLKGFFIHHADHAFSFQPHRVVVCVLSLLLLCLLLCLLFVVLCVIVFRCDSVPGDSAGGEREEAKENCEGEEVTPTPVVAGVVDLLLADVTRIREEKGLVEWRVGPPGVEGSLSRDLAVAALKEDDLDQGILPFI